MPTKKTNPNPSLNPQLVVTGRTVLGHTFADPYVLRLAVTRKRDSAVNNEGLEFLGDAVLKLATALKAFAELPGAGPGKLHEYCEAMRTNSYLAKVYDSQRMEQWRRSNVSGGSSARCSGKSKGDFIESLLGAILLDGGYEAALAAVNTMVTTTLPLRESQTESVGPIQVARADVVSPLPSLSSLPSLTKHKKPRKNRKSNQKSAAKKLPPTDAEASSSHA